MLQAFPREFDMAAALCRVTSGADLHRLRSDLDDLVFDVRVQARVQRVHSRRELEGFDEGLGDWMVILNHPLPRSLGAVQVRLGPTLDSACGIGGYTNGDVWVTVVGPMADTLECAVAPSM